MATLRESIELAEKNPNSEFANELRKRIESGQYNKLAEQEGIDISGLVKKQGSGGIGGFIKGIAQEAGQTIASVQQNIGKVASGITEAIIGTKPQEARGELLSVNTRIIRALGDLSPDDPRRKDLEDALIQNEKALQIGSQIESERLAREKSISERPEFLTPKTEAEKAGATVEKIGEFFIPSGLGLKALGATKYGRALQQAEDLNIVGKATRSLIKGIGEGADFAIKTSAQNATEDFDTQIRRSGGAFLLGLALTPVIDAAGAIIKAGLDKVTKRLPERLMSTIFKTSEEDLKAEWQTLAKGQKLNPTLAREALENDIFGSSEKMGIYSIKKLADIEKIVQADTKSSSQIIDIGIKEAKNTVQFLKDIAKQYSGPFSKTGPTALKLAKEVGNGKMNPNLVLRLKRFFDGLRTSRAFSANPILSLKQEGLKNASNVFRQKLYEAGFQEAMNQERIFIEAIDALVADAAKRGNKNVIGLVDLLAGGGGMISGGPLAGIGAAASIRAVQQPTIITNVARGIFKAGKLLEGKGTQVGNLVKPVTQLGTREILKEQANQ